MESRDGSRLRCAGAIASLIRSHQEALRQCHPAAVMSTQANFGREHARDGSAAAFEEEEEEEESSATVVAAVSKKQRRLVGRYRCFSPGAAVRM